MRVSKLSILWAAVPALGLAQCVNAAAITGSVSTSLPATVDLNTGSDQTDPLYPTYQGYVKIGASGDLSNQSISGTALSAFSEFPGNATTEANEGSVEYTYSTNTDKQGTRTATIISGNKVSQAGFAFTVANNATADQAVNFYVGGYYTKATLSATAPNADPYTDSSLDVSGDSSTGFGAVYRILIPANSGLTTVSFTNAVEGPNLGSANYANVAVFAADVSASAVPEPASLGLLGLGGLGLIRRRRAAKAA